MYVVYYRDYKNRETDKIAIWVERRRDPIKQNGLKWARIFLGELVQDSHSIFIKRKKMEVVIE
jgi:ribosomal protein L20